MSCDCKKKCNESCLCAVNNLKCTDMCSCKNCDNATTIEIYDGDDNESLDEYSDDSDEEY